MGGQAKAKKSSKPKRKQRGASRAHDLCGVPAKERMKINMQSKAKKTTAEKYSIAQLLEKVEEYVDNFNYEMAQLFCQRALDIDPTNLEILDMMGNICMELGDADKTKQVFLKSVELSPDKGHAKYMYLGQIHGKEEALQYFSKGLDVMISAYQSQPHALGAASCPDEMEVTTKDISTAFCSVAEIYLTDLCMEEGAGDKCKEAIQKALEYDPNSAEALQLMANYLFSMEQIQDGKEYLMKCVERWLPSLQKKTEDLLSENLVPTDLSEIMQNIFTRSFDVWYISLCRISTLITSGQGEVVLFFLHDFCTDKNFQKQSTVYLLLVYCSGYFIFILYFIFFVLCHI
uniref:Uncharacterized protein n=1 Tax=Leptobrachium leishanense TaxID=445787 RepID=A0A8C5QVD5_9ANUR